MFKKAAIDIQFNWIFIMIAGAMILLFFFSIISKQKQISDDRISYTLLSDLQTILTGAKVSTRTVNIVQVPDIEVQMDCSSYSVGKATAKISDIILFSPTSLKGGKIITWALDWNMPFWITNFLYLTTPQVRYIIIDDPGSLDDEILEELPDEINKQKIQSGADVFNENDYNVKFILINSPPQDNLLKYLKNMGDSHVAAINIGEQDITFYEKEGNTWKDMGKSSFLGKPLMYGAIYADKDTFDCSLQKAIQRFKNIAQIYMKRSKTLEQYYMDKCRSVHGNARADLENILNSASETFDATTVDLIESNVYHGEHSLVHQNGVAQLYSCVLIY